MKLRQLKVEDIPSLVNLASNKKVSQYILNKPFPFEEHHAVFRMSYVVQGFKKRDKFIFAIERKEHQDFIGEISLHLEAEKNKGQLAYWLGEPFWNQGFISEAIKAIIDFSFNKLDLNNIYATCHVNNEASAKVLLKNNMKAINTNGNVVLFELSKSTSN